MVVAVNTKFIFSNKEEARNFFHDCLIKIAKRFPEHTYLFIYDKSSDKEFVFPLNIIPFIVGPEIKNPLLLRLWLNYKIPSFLKKSKADIFITAVCSLRIKIPQLLLINNLTFLCQPALIPRKFESFYYKSFAAFAKKASNIIALSDFSRKNIVENYHIDNSKINVLRYGVNEIYKPANYEEKIRIKDQYSGGTEYFLFVRSDHNVESILVLLKAFSIFKKWQKSSMQLIIVLNNNAKNDDLNESLRLFKYRNEVKQIEQPEESELVKIIASAYVVIHLTNKNNDEIPFPECMRCAAPVITRNKEPVFEFFGKAALYTDSDEPKEIADKMMMIFKDENLRDELIKRSREQANKFKGTTSAKTLWDSILKATT